MNDASLLTQAALLQESRVVIVIAGMAGAALRGGRSHAGPGVSPRADRRGLWRRCRASGHTQQKVAAQAQVPNQTRGDRRADARRGRNKKTGSKLNRFGWAIFPEHIAGRKMG